MTNKHQIEITFIQRSAAQFTLEINKLQSIINSKNFDYEQILQLTALIAVKENIESLEAKILNLP